MERRALTVDDRAFESVLERADEQLRNQLSEASQQFLRENVEHSKNDPNLSVEPPYRGKSVVSRIRHSHNYRWIVDPSNPS